MVCKTILIKTFENVNLYLIFVLFYYKYYLRYELFQFEAALAVDSVRLIDKTLSKLVVRNPDIVRNTLRNGKFYNNNSEGIDCDSDPVVPWRYGHEIMKVLKQVSMQNVCFVSSMFVGIFFWVQRGL